MMIFLLALLSVAHAEDPLQQEQIKEVSSVKESVDDLAVIVAFARDRDLAKQGYAPEDWEQPSLDVYGAELDGRPSLLPLESIQKAREDKRCSPLVLERYLAWTAEQEAQKAAAK